MESSYQLVIYPSASKDIENICKYISIELANPKAANDFLDELYESFKSLVVFPKIYPLIDNQFVSDQSIRKMPVKRYMVFYRITNTEIQVIRVLHGRSDYITLLK